MVVEREEEKRKLFYFYLFNFFLFPYIAFLPSAAIFLEWKGQRLKSFSFFSNPFSPAVTKRQLRLESGFGSWDFGLGPPRAVAHFVGEV